MKFEQDLTSSLFDLIFPVLEDERLDFIFLDDSKKEIKKEPEALARLIASCAGQFYEDSNIVEMWDYLENNKQTRKKPYAELSTKLFAYDLMNSIAAMKNNPALRNASKEEKVEAFRGSFPVEKRMMNELVFGSPFYVEPWALPDEVVKDFIAEPDKYIERVLILTSTFKRLQLWEDMCKIRSGNAQKSDDFLLLTDILRNSYNEFEKKKKENGGKT